MNVLKRGESKFDSAERLKALAENKKTIDPEYEPVRLVLTDVSKTSWKTTNFDVFKMQSTWNAERGRDIFTLNIVKVTEERFCEWVYFTDHPQTFEMFAYVPRTEHNMRVLASHLADKLWTIGTREVHDEAVKIASTMTHVRDSASEHAPVSWQEQQIVKNGEMEKVMAENAKLKEMLTQGVLQQPAPIEAPAPVPVAPAPEPVVEAPKKRKKERVYEESEIAERKAAKELIIKNNPDFPEQMKEKYGHNKWWITKDYRVMLKEYLPKVKEEINAQY